MRRPPDEVEKWTPSPWQKEDDWLTLKAVVAWSLGMWAWTLSIGGVIIYLLMCVDAGEWLALW